MDDNINIFTELKDAGSTILLNANRSNMYFISPDYFNNLPRDVMSRIFVESIPRINPYSVPTGYFDQLSTIILENINAHDTAPMLDGVGEMLYAVPEGYFETFASNVLKKIKGETIDSVQAELEELSPLLSKIPKTNVYAIPDGYFDALTPLKKEDENRPAKVISFGARTRRLAKLCCCGMRCCDIARRSVHIFFKTWQRADRKSNKKRHRYTKRTL
jgi:hypothetical protein